MQFKIEDPEQLFRELVESIKGEVTQEKVREQLLLQLPPKSLVTIEAYSVISVWEDRGNDLPDVYTHPAFDGNLCTNTQVWRSKHAEGATFGYVPKLKVLINRADESETHYVFVAIPA